MKFKIVVFLLISFILVGCSSKNWKINGIPMQDFKTTPKNYVKLIGGAGTSFLVHYLGHVVYLESNGIEWHQSGLNEVIDEPISNKDKRWSGRIGFVSQLAGGVVLKFGPWSEDFKNGYFTTGYHIGTALEVCTYPIRWDDTGDLDMIERGNGNEDLEYGIYSVSSLLLLK